MKKVTVLCYVVSILFLGVFVTACNSIEASTQASDDIEDLTQFDSTLLYGAVGNIISNYDSYIGRTIRMTGSYMQAGTQGDKTYDMCIVQDETMCCSTGFEFVVDDNFELPEIGSTITVQGVLKSYIEDGNTYIYLTDADVTLN